MLHSRIDLAYDSKTIRPCDHFYRRVIESLRRFFDILGLKTLWSLSDGEFYAVSFF